MTDIDPRVAGSRPRELYLEYKRELQALDGNKPSKDEELNFEMDYGGLINMKDAWWFDLTNGSGEIIGFVAISLIGNLEVPYHEREHYDYFVQECYVIPRYRRKGVVGKFMTELISAHPGKWGLYILDSNQPAHDFWGAIASRVGGRWKRVAGSMVDDYGQEYCMIVRRKLF